MNNKSIIVVATAAALLGMGLMAGMGLLWKENSQMDVSAIAQASMPSSVIFQTKVKTESDPAKSGGKVQEMNEAATGFIWEKGTETLLIVTNNHVVRAATKINIRFTPEKAQGLLIPAQLVGTNPSFDLAVVSVKRSDIPEDIYAQLKAAQLGTSSNLKVGQPVIAIGNACGQGQSVTSGIISALNRRIEGSYSGLEGIVTDAAINFGNSGSMLLDGKGKVVGINTAKELEPSEGMGYFIPIDTAVPVVKELITNEKK